MSENQDLARGLKNRHVQLLAIGGAIGTGLFLGSGRSIHLAGPSILGISDGANLGVAAVML